ncbi:MAG: tol-pal system protein YbgF [Chitinivibrionales bacterium]|nr:tol-pal system protein YbgF [Chitinivibrionales bacterium]
MVYHAKSTTGLRRENTRSGKTSFIVPVLREKRFLLFKKNAGNVDKSICKHLLPGSGIYDILCRNHNNQGNYMKKRVQYCCLLPVALLAGICGCAGTAGNAQNDMLLPEIDVVQVKENSDEALRLAQEAKLDVEVVNTKLTEMDNKLVLLNEEISSVSIAKIEELENRLSLIIEAVKDLQAQIDALEVMPRVKVTKKPRGPATFSVSSPEYAAYQNALHTFNARKYKKARMLFSDVLKQYPQGKYADNCRYWIGECYYALGDYAQAIASFSKVFDYPNSSKADDAQHKLGKCYLKMGQNAMAKKAWKKLIDRYPGSEYVPRAQQSIADLK